MDRAILSYFLHIIELKMSSAEEMSQVNCNIKLLQITIIKCIK